MTADPGRHRASTDAVPTDQPFSGHRLGDASYRRISVALFAAGLATFAQLYSTQPLLPQLAGRFSVSAAASTLSLSVCTAALGVGLVLLGPVSEVVGRTRLIHLSLLLSSTVGLLCAIAPSWHVLLALRTLEGLTLAGLPAIAMAYLREEVHNAVHARAAGLYVAGTALGGMSGRLVGGALGDAAGWRWGVGGIAVIGVLCAVLVRWLLPASRNFTPLPADPGGLLRLTVRPFTDPALLGLYGIAFTLMGAFMAVYNAMTFRLVGPPYRLSLALAGLVFLVYPIGSLGSMYAGRLASRYGRRPVLPLCCLVTLTGLLVTLSSPLWLVVLGLAVMTTGFFAAHGIASGWVVTQAHLGVGGIGSAASLYLFAYYLGSSVFGSVAGDAWSRGGWSMVVAVAGLLVVAGLVFSVLLRRIPSLAVTVAPHA